MGKQIFISHSGTDRLVVDKILKSFNGTGVEPILMKNKTWQHNQDPNWLWIKKQIIESQALFVILTKGIVAKRHTQNWVSFEIGISAGLETPRRVFVIQGENVNFPIPFLNHYFPYSLTFKTQQFKKAKKAHFEGLADNVMKLYIQNPYHEPDFNTVFCPNCHTGFYYHGGESAFRCPVCSFTIDRFKHQENYPN